MKGWAYLLLPLAGALGLYVSPLFPSDPPVTYSEVIVSVHEIESREPPESPGIVERIRFVEAAPYRTAKAPGGGEGELSRFCRPVVLRATAENPDSAPPAPRRELARSIVTRPSVFPLMADRLMVTTVSNTGDLLARDYAVRPGWDVRAGDSLTVRVPRFAVAREIGEGLLWWAGIELGRYLFGALGGG